MTEKSLSTQISYFMQTQYPRIIYRFDYGADVKLSIGQAKRMKMLQGRWSRGYPDLVILMPKGRYSALFIELKIVTPYKKNGDLKTNKHLEEQAAMMTKLSDAGYKTTFTVGFDETVAVIKNYLNRAI